MALHKLRYRRQSPVRWPSKIILLNFVWKVCRKTYENWIRKSAKWSFLSNFSSSNKKNSKVTTFGWTTFNCISSLLPLPFHKKQALKIWMKMKILSCLHTKSSWIVHSCGKYSSLGSESFKSSEKFFSYPNWLRKWQRRSSLMESNCIPSNPSPGALSSRNRQKVPIPRNTQRPMTLKGPFCRPDRRKSSKRKRQQAEWNRQSLPKRWAIETSRLRGKSWRRRTASRRFHSEGL